LTRNIRYLLAIFLLGLLATAQGEPLRVTVLTSDDGAAYHDFAQAFSVEARRQNLLMSIVPAVSPVPETDIVIAVGGKAAAAALKTYPVVLCVLVSRSVFEKLLQESPVQRTTRSVSAIYLDQPFKRQIALINVALPSTRNIGILFSEQSADILNLRKVIAESRFALREQRSHSTDSLHYDLQSLLQASDVLLAIPDIQIYNPTTMRNILLSAYRGNVPLIGISPAYVRAGALCAVFSTPEQIAVQAAYMTRQYAETAKLPVPQYPTEFEVAVNQQVARSLGLQIMDGAVIAKQMKADSASWGGK
jgi:ABC-type uncharacterized transport system substrate-binding protein